LKSTSTDPINGKDNSAALVLPGNKKKIRKKGDGKDEKKTNITGGKVAAVTVGGVIAGALTAGIGLMAGMIVVGMGAAGGGGAVAFNQMLSDKEKSVTLACDSYHEAEIWVHAIEIQIRELGDNLLGLPFVPGNNTYAVRSKRHVPPPEVRLEAVEEWIRSSKWRVHNVTHGIRIFSEVPDESFKYLPRKNDINSELPPCLRVNVNISGSVTDVFMAIMNLPSSCRTGIVRSIRVVESISNYADIVHIILEPVYIYPTWTSPRDFCLMRYWKHNADGSYVICYDSTFHHDCPLTPHYIRADLHAAYLISPPKDGRGDGDEDHMECLLTYIAQLDPHGWIWRYGGFQEKLLEQYLMSVLDIRDALDSDRFIQAHFDPVNERKLTSKAAQQRQNTSQKDNEISMGNTPPSVLPPDVWSEPDHSTFRVRGKNYNLDKIKVSPASTMFKLIAVDLLETTESQHNISAHPRNRVNMALQRGDKTWVFVLNIMVPGPPYLSFVAYLQGDKSLFEEDTPFGRIARPFFNGNDDDFRNNRFKLIPKVIDGNMLIKMAVKDTPTLLGNKLKQYYYKGDNYFEIDVDVGSSSVARNVVGLAMGYAKNIIVDMGMCLQGNDESELPEVMLGGVTCIKVDTTKAKKL
jgi:hypothetical protein